jgi:hypothetical protein
MGRVGWKHFYKQRKFLFCHRFYNELFVVGKKEKGAGATSAFPSLENHISIEFGA